MASCINLLLGMRVKLKEDSCEFNDDTGKWDGEVLVPRQTIGKVAAIVSEDLSTDSFPVMIQWEHIGAQYERITYVAFNEINAQHSHAWVEVVR